MPFNADFTKPMAVLFEVPSIQFGGCGNGARVGGSFVVRRALGGGDPQIPVVRSVAREHGVKRSYSLVRSRRGMMAERDKPWQRGQTGSGG